MAIDPDSILGEAVSTVKEQISELGKLSAEYNNRLSSALSSISNVRVDSVPSPVRPQPLVTAPPAVNIGQIPNFSPGSLNIPSMPSNFSINLSALDVDIGDLPPMPSAIPISIPNAPSMANISAPARPAIDTSVDLPDAPTVVIPEMEQLINLNLPVFEYPEMPDFNGVPPDVSGITVPNVFINWVEPVYESELLDDLQAKIKTMMAGGTGLPAPIEDAIFSRARQRESAETQRNVQEAVDTWASRNFSMPPGMLVKAVDVAREQGRLKTSELNRDIMIEAAKWEIENIRFGVERGIALEQLTTNMFENMAKRSFEVARFYAESQISVFNAQIGLFNAQNSAFETLANVYRTRLDGAIAKLNAYKIAVDGQVALGQINQQRVEVYKAKLSAVQAAVDVYTATVQGARVRAETIKNQFDAYRTDVQAFAEQIGAEKVKFDAYESRIKGEQAKADVFDSQSRAYAATIQGMASRADVKIKNGQLKIESARTTIAKYQADIEGFKANIDANLSRLQFETSAYQARVEGFRSHASLGIADAEMKSRYADMNARTNIAFSEMQISEYQAKMQDAIQKANIALEAAKAVGQYTAQLAAGAMSAAHVSASISGSGSASTSGSTSVSTNTNHNYTY